GSVRLRRVVRSHLYAPRVGANGRNFLVLAPIAILELDAGRVATRVAAPFLLLETALQLSGADDDEIAPADLDVLLLGATVEFVVGNTGAVLRPVRAAETRDIDQHTATRNPAL